MCVYAAVITVLLLWLLCLGVWMVVLLSSAIRGARPVTFFNHDTSRNVLYMCVCVTLLLHSVSGWLILFCFWSRLLGHDTSRNADLSSMFVNVLTCTMEKLCRVALQFVRKWFRWNAEEMLTLLSMGMKVKISCTYEQHTNIYNLIWYIPAKSKNINYNDI